MDEPPLRVLIADDEPLAAERLQLLLARSDGVDLVGTASDGEAAVRLAEGLQPDVMLLDVGARSWLIHHSMAALEERLDPQLFVRLHRSAIVRRDYISGFSRNPSGRWIARLGDDSEQPVGRLYADRVRSIAGR